MVEIVENSQLEQEIVQIEKDLATKREALLEQNKEMPHEKEVLHSVVREKIHPSQPTALPTPAPSASPQAIPPELHQKVQALVNVAFTKSIDEAIKEARATNNAALIDAFHDLLVDELYQHLVERGKLKQM
ncbi:MAG: hypothetical protein AAB483_02125 [Patescibacteria group bacterium]